ncbi:sodium:solute symporter family protein [Sinanaerobacter chloroacetimidivorans]|jgi:SSS family solute:Na+ symporter|uniref:Sodium:solute symporter family protein n=1 Tax=Sinanaerobacter chloroacetimidivorans TaxID=2818044 RepID=A0A8J7W4Q3_9FIRM|nr:sodium:solute symporter family protein [Sinanaerobacter chloroacetimidivorans]MBR0598910.1 sodium:solute symporter family protein [Sinanaerobacter chloroacetimidivorans]
MAASTPVLLIIFIFAFLPLILAEFARNKSLPTIEDFFLLSRRMPTYMVFFTVYATWMSAFAFLGASAYFYQMGPVYMTAIAWDIFFGLLFMIIGKRIWFYGKVNNYVTPTDFFRDIFGYKPLSIIITCVMVIFTIPYLQIQLSGGAYLIEVATSGLIPWRISGLIFYLIIIIYLWAGGLRAVALTDIFYGACLFISMLFIGFFMVNKAGGMEYVFATITKLNVGNVTLPGPKGNEGALLWLSMFVMVPIGALMGPQMWIRCYAVEKKTTFDIIPVFICLAAIQCIGTLLAGSTGILLVPGVSQLDKIIPVMLLKYSDEVLCTLLFCGIASSALSTANSQIHAVAAIYTIDIHKGYISRNSTEKKLVAVGKWAVLAISLIAYVLLLNNPVLIIDTGTVAMGGTAQVFVPVIGALFWSKSNGKAAAAGILSGIFVLSVLAFVTALNVTYCAALALIFNGAIFVIGSMTFKTNLPTREKIVKYKKEYDNKI